MAKFHSCVILPDNITPAEKCITKSYAFYLTDAETPIIGDYVTALLDHVPENVAHNTIHEHVNSLDGLVPFDVARTGCDPLVQYSNERASWMYDVCNRDIPGFDWELFEKALANCHDIDDFLHMPCCCEAKGDNTVVTSKSGMSYEVDGQIYGNGNDDAADLIVGSASHYREEHPVQVDSVLQALRDAVDKQLNATGKRRDIKTLRPQREHAGMNLKRREKSFPSSKKFQHATKEKYKTARQAQAPKRA
jgi:hypothetical protein